MAKTQAEIQKEYEKRTSYSAQKKYMKNNIKRVPLNVQNEEYEEIKEHTKKTNETVNGFIKRAISETMKKDMENF